MTPRHGGLIVVVIVAAGCTESSPSTDPQVRTVTATVEVAIGELEGADEYVFGRVGGVAGDGSRIFVADNQADAIRAYDWNGEFLYDVANRGEGPGEVRRPCCLAVDQEGKLWVRDGGNGRYNVYSVAAHAEFITSFRMVHGSRGLWVAPAFDAGGNLIDVGHSGPSQSGMTTTRRHYLDSLGSISKSEDLPPPPLDSVPVHTVTREVRGGVATLYFQQPFGPAHLIAHSPLGGFATAVSSHYAVRWIGPDSTFDRVLTAPAIGRRVLPSERDSAVALLNERLRSVQMTFRDMPFGVPDRHPTLRQLQFDALGRLWVHLTPDHTGPYTARVHDRNGEVVMNVQWPRDVELRFGFIGDGFALGVRTDSLGVQEVIRMSY